MIEIPNIPYRLEDPIYLLAIPIAILLIWFFVKRDFITFKNKEEKRAFILKKKWEKRLVIIFRSLTIALMIIALCSPFITEEREIIGDPHVTVLVDNSTSFAIFDQKIVDNVVESLKKYMPVKVRYVGYDERSEVGDALINIMQGNGESVLLITDGHVTHGSTLDNAFTNAAISEVTINTLNIKPDKDDLSVRVEGPSQNIIALPSDFSVIINNVGDDLVYSLYVQLDNKTVIKEEGLSGSFTKSFSANLEQGYHTIRAWVDDVDDFFPENNAYLKTIQILPRPRILFVSEQASPMIEILEKNYNLETLNYIPSDLSKYYATVLNDIPIEKINPKFEDLNAYVTDGDGLVVIGGKNSYEKGGYKGSLFETLLPVRIGTGIKSGASGVNVVIVIDASYSFRGEAVDYAKALAVDIISNARPQDAVGAIAFRSGGGTGERTKTVVELTPLMNKSVDFEQEFLENIGYIQGAGGTDIYAGLKRAEVMVQGEDNVNLIVISDGQQVLNRDNSIKKALSLAAKGYKIFTIGYSNAGLSDVDEDFLQAIADAGDGIYTGMDHPLPIEFIFEAGEEGEDEFQESDTGVGEALLAYDSNDFIIRNVPIETGTITGYNAIVPKKPAHKILYTITGNNVLSWWKFGLGNVVAFGTDDGRAWSGPLLASDASIVIPKMINLAIRNPNRKEAFYVELFDTRVGENTIVKVHSTEKPEWEDFVFVKTDEREYTTEYIPQRKEFRTFFGYVQAVNYPLEYRDVGMNSHFLNLIRKGTYKSGRVFNPEEIDSLVEKIKEDSIIKEPVTTYVRWPLVLAALLIFLFEVCVRRIIQYRR